MGTVNTLKWSQFASIAKNDMLDNDQKVYFTGKSKSGLCCNVAGEARTFSNPQTLAADSETMRRTLLALATKKLGGENGANADVIKDIAKKLTGEGRQNGEKLLATPLDKRVISDVVKQVFDITKKGVYNSVRDETTGELKRVDAQIGVVNTAGIDEYKNTMKAVKEAAKATIAKTESDWDNANTQTKDGKAVYTHEATVKRCHDFVCAPEFKEYRQAAVERKEDYDIVYDLVEFGKDSEVGKTGGVTGNEGASKPKRMKAVPLCCSCISKVITSDEWNPDGTFTVINAGDAGRYFGTVSGGGFDEALRRSSIPTVGGIFFEEGLVAPNPESKLLLNVCTDERGLGKMHTTNGVFYKCTATNVDTRNTNGVGGKIDKAKNYNIVDFAMPSLAMDDEVNFDILSCSSWMDKCNNLQHNDLSIDAQDKLRRTPKQIADFKQILAEVRDKTCICRKGGKKVAPKMHIKDLDKPSVLAASAPNGLRKPTRANDLMLMGIFGGEKFRKLLDLFDGKTKGKADAFIKLAKNPEKYKEALQEAVENYKATLRDTFTKIYDGLIKKGIKQVALPLVGGGYYQNLLGVSTDVLAEVAAEKSDKIQTLVITAQTWKEATNEFEDDAKSVYLRNKIDEKIDMLEQREQQQGARSVPAAENA